MSNMGKKIEPLKNPLGQHTNCNGHKMSFLEDSLDLPEEKALLLRILNNYYEEEK